MWLSGAELITLHSNSIYIGKKKGAVLIIFSKPLAAYKLDYFYYFRYYFSLYFLPFYTTYINLAITYYYPPYYGPVRY